VAGDLGGELGAAGDVELGEHVTRWGCTVRREMYCRSPICGLVRPEPLRPGRGAAADRGLPGRYRQLNPGSGAVVRDLGDRHGQAGASINLGELLSLSLAYREARGYFVQALSIARDIDTPAGEAQALRESDEATSKKETQAKAPETYNALAIYRELLSRPADQDL
jgi:hypothetical protein